ncbi:hypothetical protein GCM10010103_78960 [Streptomyces paradoxus]
MRHFRRVRDAAAGREEFTAIAQDGIRVHIDVVRKINPWKDVSTRVKKIINLTIPSGKPKLLTARPRVTPFHSRNDRVEEENGGGESGPACEDAAGDRPTSQHGQDARTQSAEHAEQQDDGRSQAEQRLVLVVQRQFLI